MIFILKTLPALLILQGGVCLYHSEVHWKNIYRLAKSATVFDVSHMGEIQVVGTESTRFLEKILTKSIQSTKLEEQFILQSVMRMEAQLMT